MKRQNKRWGLVVAGLAVTAVAGCSTAGMHVSGSPQVQSKPVVVVQQATPRVEQARMVAPSGPAAFRSWWVHGGYKQYQNVANDLNLLIITDTLQDTTNDATFYADAHRLAADATAASRNLPPVDAAGYRAGMRALAQVGRRQRRRQLRQGLPPDQGRPAQAGRVQHRDQRLGHLGAWRLLGLLGHHGTVVGVTIDGCCLAKAVSESFLTADHSGPLRALFSTCLPLTTFVGAVRNVPLLLATFLKLDTSATSWELLKLLSTVSALVRALRRSIVDIGLVSRRVLTILLIAARSRFCCRSNRVCSEIAGSRA